MNRRRVSPTALAGLVLAVLAAGLAAVAGFGSRFGAWQFGTGFTLLQWAVYLAVLAAVVSLTGIVLSLRAAPRGALVAGAGLLVAALVVGLPWQWRRTARSVPPIHDISTDTRNPPEFVAVAPLRASAPNPIEYGGDSIAAQQRAAYPELQPVAFAGPPEQAFAAALAAARQMGWEIVDAAPEAGRIEATDQTFWFGFKDDVVVRITPVAGGSWVDVRSLSRVGGSDVGTNARRIREYLQTLTDSSPLAVRSGA